MKLEAANGDIAPEGRRSGWTTTRRPPRWPKRPRRGTAPLRRPRRRTATGRPRTSARTGAEGRAPNARRAAARGKPPGAEVPRSSHAERQPAADHPVAVLDARARPRAPSRQEPLRELRPTRRRGTADDAVGERSDARLGPDHGDRRGERDFYIRQPWDAKGSSLVETMDPKTLFYGEICGWTLVRSRAPATRSRSPPTWAPAAPSTRRWPPSQSRTPTRTGATTRRSRRRSRPDGSSPRRVSRAMPSAGAPRTALFHPGEGRRSRLSLPWECARVDVWGRARE